MIKLVLLMIAQSSMLVLSQVFLKVALRRAPSEGLTLISRSIHLITDIRAILAVLSLVVSGLIWIFVLKKYDFSLAYPLVSISYIIAMLVSYFYFKENINGLTIAGVSIIMLGVVLLTLSKKII